MKVSLLIVEDDKEAVVILRGMIERQLPDVTVYVAEDGRTGLKLFKQHTPDIVITDINLPDVDGLIMAEEIKAMKDNTKFIVVTGYSNKMDFCGSIGIEDYFVKPTDFKRLVVAIERSIGKVLLERK